MLNSIKIQNYRNLENLSIERLGRVNLIIGKNNTGKTSLLEAISIFLQKGNIRWIFQLLEERGENIKKAEDNRKYQTNNIKFLSGLFWGRKPSFKNENKILIGSMSQQSNLFGIQDFEDYVSLRFVKYTVDITVTEGTRISRQQILDDGDSTGASENGFEIATPEKNNIISLENDRLYRSSTLGMINRISIFDGADVNIQFIRTNNILRETNSILWDKITLSDKEKYVEQGLKIVEKKIERISFIGETSGRYEERSAVVRLMGDDLVIPLRSMGDGINRILTIILAMVNCENGTLLIDEFENGLHFSVQEKLWEIIFDLSERLKIQVFVTTHSSDTIRAFENIINQNENNSLDGLLIKLENIEDKIESVTFEPNELRVITDNLIEVRK